MPQFNTTPPIPYDSIQNQSEAILSGIGAARSIQIVTASTLTAVRGGRYLIATAGLCNVTNPTGTNTKGDSYELWIGVGATVQFEGTGTVYQPSRFSVRRECTVGGSPGTWVTPLPALADQLQLTGQTLQDANSVVTQGLGDARYARIFAARQGAQLTKTNNVPETIASVTVPAGTYRVFVEVLARVANNGNTAGGSVMELTGVTWSNVTGMTMRLATLSTAAMDTAYLVNATSISRGVAPADYSSSQWWVTGAGGVIARFEGIATCTAGTVNLQVRQFTTNAEPTIFPANCGYLQMTRIS